MELENVMVISIKATSIAHAGREEKGFNKQEKIGTVERCQMKISLVAMDVTFTHFLWKLIQKINGVDGHATNFN